MLLNDMTLNESTGEEKSQLHLPTPTGQNDKNKKAPFLQLARKLAEENAGQCPTIHYHIHWVYSQDKPHH